MNIGDLARETGLTASKIRFYERIGLFTLVDRKSNGYRTYPDEAVAVLELITNAQKAGFSLDEIRTLVPQDLSSGEHDALIAALETKIADIAAMEAQLAESRKRLTGLIADIQSKPEGMDCADNAKRVLSRLFSGTGKVGVA